MSEWRDIATAPVDREVFFWVVPKQLGDDNVYATTSGEPIVGRHAPYLFRGKWKTWGALSKATHWMPLPDPPRADIVKESAPCPPSEQS